MAMKMVQVSDASILSNSVVLDSVRL